ncbi:DNA-binding transcriptional regulator LsrR (DeoR family) [Trueperella bonasi]|uniref:DNA-binding transcriptional regulator LsrR (DeoR family) n=1 Tax=Trueperella bonasi TaxID=312286 RepID=A0ABT9NGX1_9ACTO|nr:sugar-binding domain-containing protein [Trueperella bonasi]MDP9806660.1 DNA-binding transcriptional regulator LsrR (DeoR family) [Trueperella bonasi]
MNERAQVAYQAAVMHFVQGETMESIARRLSVSRSTVSRLIAEAKETGLVQVTIHPPQAAASELQNSIVDMFDVRVKVVPVPFGVNETRRLNAVAQVAAMMVSELMKPGTIIGVAWGNTIAALVDHLVPRPARGSIAVQLNGAANASTTGVPYAGSLMEEFRKAFGSESQYFSVPAFFDFAQTRDALWRERSINSVRETQKNADVALFGIGSMTSNSPSLVYSGGYLSADEIKNLREDGVVGDICTVLLRADGSWEDLEINSRASGPTPADLKNIPKRIGVVSGTDKVTATVAALRAGVITDLVIDEDSAELLYGLARRSNNPR